MSNAIDGGMLVPEPAMAQMFPSGVFVDLLAPKAELIRPEDVAHHLGMLCRYSGGTRRFYSVAEHACLVADLLAWQQQPEEIVLAGLLHDAAEAYVGDMISPLKFAMRLREALKYGLSVDTLPGDNGAWFVKPDRELRGVFSEIADGFDEVIAERFHLDPEALDCQAVKTADMWALRIEAAELTYSGGANWRWPGELPNGGEKPDDVSWCGGLPPYAATCRFELTLARLLGGAS